MLYINTNLQYQLSKQIIYVNIYRHKQHIYNPGCMNEYEQSTQIRQDISP